MTLNQPIVRKIIYLKLMYDKIKIAINFVKS